MDKKFKGSHDITHCVGFNCPLRKSCYRYIAYLDLKNYKFPVSMLSDPIYDYENKECTMYWKY